MKLIICIDCVVVLCVHLTKKKKKKTERKIKKIKLNIKTVGLYNVFCNTCCLQYLFIIIIDCEQLYITDGFTNIVL